MSYDTEIVLHIKINKLKKIIKKLLHKEELTKEENLYLQKQGLL